MKNLVPSKPVPPFTYLYNKILFSEFIAICNLLVYCYAELYANADFLLDKHEGYHRTLLIKKARLNKDRFGVDYKFYPEVGVFGEKDPDVTGRVDIFAISNGWSDEDWYYAFECKRLSKNSKNRTYINDGLSRFVIDEKYSPIMPWGGMIGFIEKGAVKDIINDIQTRLKKNKNPIMCSDLKPYKLNNFDYCYYSSHIRSRSKRGIEIYHIFMDLQ